MLLMMRAMTAGHIAALTPPAVAYNLAMRSPDPVPWCT